jgi:hypothetical protein
LNSRTSETDDWPGRTLAGEMMTYLSFQFRVGDDRLNADYRPLHKEVIFTATPSAVPTWRWREEVEEQFRRFLDDVERWAQRSAGAR